MKRTTLIRRSGLKRGGFLRRRPNRRSVVTAETFAAIWREDLGPCIVCPAEGRVCIGQVQGHHAITKQTLRKRGLFFETLDVRNRVPVCEYRHEQHTTGYKPIPREVLPASVFEFATELGLEWWIDKHYPVLEAVA